MSDDNKYLFHQNVAGDKTSPEVNGIYADPILAGITKSHHPVIGATFAATTGSYIMRESIGFLNSEYLKPEATYIGLAGILPENSFLGIYNDYLTPKATYNGFTGVLAEQGSSDISSYLSTPQATVYGTAFLSDKPTRVFTNILNSGFSGNSIFSIGSTTSCFTGVGTIAQTLNAGFNQGSSVLQISANSCLHTNSAYYCGGDLYGYTAQHKFSVEEDKYGLDKPKNSSLYGAVVDYQYQGAASVFSFDTWINPKHSHQYNDGTACLKMFDTPNDYLGYGEQIGKRTKEILALRNQLSLLENEAVWLNSKVTDDFYKSIYAPYGEDLFTYLQSWSEQVKVKIQRVVEKFDRLCKYIIKLKIGAGTIRRINKKRVFRTKVNLVFKNLDDAHPSELNYFNSAINVIHQTFKYNPSWKLTYNN